MAKSLNSLKVYHKSTCITCKRTISELERMKIDFDKRDFFKDQLSESELKKIISLAGIKPKEMLRKKDKTYKELNLDNSKQNDSQIIKLMATHPGLIRRPIIISKNRALIGKIDPKQL